MMIRARATKALLAAAAARPALHSAPFAPALPAHSSRSRLSFALPPSASLASAARCVRRPFSTTTPSPPSSPSTVSPAADSTATVATAADSTLATASAATPKPGASKSLQSRFRAWLDRNQLKFVNFGISGATLLAIYSLYSAGFGEAIDFYLEQRELDSPYLAFITGSVITAANFAMYRASRRLYRLNSARMYREVLRSIFRNEEVKERFGADVRAKTLLRMAHFAKPAADSATPVATAPAFRRVSFLPSGFRRNPTADGWKRLWQPRRLQMMLWIEGSKGGGLASAEVEQMLRGEFDELNFLAIDVLSTGEQIVVKKHTDARKKKADLTDAEEEKSGVMRGKDLLSTQVRKH